MEPLAAGAAPPLPAAGRCSRCGEPNRCSLAERQAGEMARDAKPCWCVGRTFPAALSSSLPKDRCVCERCLDAFERGRSADHGPG